jgi:hemerythrin-like domain-containing protein
MKRDSRLRGLSSDHHQALVQARRATRAASSDEAEASGTWAEVLERFQNDILPHFEIEERLLLPALRDEGEAELVERTLAEHAGLRQCVAESAGDDKRPQLRRFGDLLTAHVRFEERILFAVAQERLSGEVLESISRATSARADPRRK